MNKSKFAKILITALTFCLLLGAIVGITASASGETVTPEIIASNVEYSSRTYLYYAVPVDSIPEADRNAENGFWLEVRNTDGSLVFSKVYPEAETSSDPGVECYIFKTRGVPAKELNTKEVVQVITASGAKSESVTWSVEDYLYGRLYGDKFATKTEADGDDYLKKTLYYDLLKYGAIAQELLCENITDAIGDTAYADVPAAVATLGKLDQGDYIRLEYDQTTEASGVFSGWDYTKYDSNGEVAMSGYAKDGSSFYVDGYFTATPYYFNPVLDSCDSIPSLVVSPSAAPNGWDIVADPTDSTNNVYHTNRTASGTGSSFSYNHAKSDSDATATIFEMDMYWKANNRIIMEIKFLQNAQSKQRAVFAYITNANFYFYENGVAGAKQTTTVAQDKWIKVRIEYRVIKVDGVDTPEVRMYVDGVLVGISYKLYEKTFYNTDGSFASVPTPGSLTRASVLVSSSVNSGDVYLDNISFGHADLPVAENVVANPNAVDFSSDYTSKVTVSTNSNFAALNTWEVQTDSVTGDKVLFIDKAGTDSSGSTYNGGVTFKTSVTNTEANANTMVYGYDITMKNMTACDSQMTMNHSGKDGKKYSPFLFTLPKIYNQKLRVEIIYRPTTITDGVVTAFEASLVINGEVTETVTEIYKQASELLNGNVALPQISSINSITSALNNSFLGDAYIDNVSLELLYIEGNNPTIVTNAE